MSDTLKFPNGYDVTVCRKQDILDCLDKNILDKELVLTVIEQCEIDASNFLREGRWAGIPFIGSIRIPKFDQKMMSNETKELIDEAKQKLDKDKYILFKSKLCADTAIKVKEERYFQYIVSMFVTRNREFYFRKVDKLGESGAKFLCYTLANISPIYNPDL